MCTNYIPTRGDRLQTFFSVDEPEAAVRDEAWPGYMAPIILANLKDSRAAGRWTPDRSVAPPERTSAPARLCEAACFGLIPGWSRDGRNYRHCYNARSETVAEKPSFRNAWRRRQFCVIPADTIFEPSYESGHSVRWQISREDGAPFALAGIWESWRRPPAEPSGRLKGPTGAITDADDWLLSFSLLTVNADRHSVMNRFHAPDDEKRSIVALPIAAVDQWLNAKIQDALEMLLAPDAATLITQAAPLARKSATAPSIAPAKPRSSTTKPS